MLGKTDIEVGKFYVAEISGNLSIVKITGVCVTGGWWAIIVETDSQVILNSADCFQREATGVEVSTKKVGATRQSAEIKFVIKDGPRSAGFDELIKMMVAGATLPNAEPIPEATAEIFGRIARGEPDIQVGPQCDIITEGRVEVGNPPSFRKLAKVILDLTAGQDIMGIKLHTGQSFVRCEEILEVRDKLLDILE